MTISFSQLLPGVFQRTDTNTTSVYNVEKERQMELDIESTASSVNTSHAEISSQRLQGELSNEDAQRGVKDAEAVTLIWSKTTLIAVFVK